MSWKAAFACVLCVSAFVAVVAQTSPAEIKLRISAMQNLKRLGTAATLYAGANDSNMPYVRSTASMFGVIKPYLKKEDAVWNPRKGLKFVFNMHLAGVKLDDVQKREMTPLFYDDKFYTDGTKTIVFSDTRVASFSKASWPPVGKATAWKFKRRPGMKPLPKDYLLKIVPKSLGGKAPG